MTNDTYTADLLQETTGEADRKVTGQPLVFLSQDGASSRFNLRKFSELPYHLIREEKRSFLIYG